MGTVSTWLILLLIGTSVSYSFPTEYSVLRESTAQGAAPYTQKATSPHPFQQQIGRPSAEVDRHVTPVPLRASRFY